MKYALMPLIICLVLMCSCTDEQIRQAQVISDRADQLLASSKQAIASAEQALAVAQQLAEATKSQQAAYAVQVAHDALEQVKATLPAIEASQQTAHASLDAAKASQEAGGSTIDVLIAIAAVAIPGLGAVAAAVRRGNGWATAFQQTVDGLQNARKAMPVGVWKDSVAPHLASAQDAAVKDLVVDHLPPSPSI